MVVSYLKVSCITTMVTILTYAQVQPLVGFQEIARAIQREIACQNDFVIPMDNAPHSAQKVQLEASPVMVLGKRKEIAILGNTVIPMEHVLINALNLLLLGLQEMAQEKHKETVRKVSFAIQVGHVLNIARDQHRVA